jgi:uncharacterized protein (DUF3820 family)
MMTEARLNLVQPILDTFENEDIKEFAVVLLDNVPEYVWHVGASSTGKYHPQYSLGEGGLMRHQMAVVRFLNFFLGLEQYSNKIPSRERDLMRIAALTHDARKSGTQEDYERSKYTKFNHPILMADVIRSYDGKYLNHDELELIANTISKHMGQWNSDKKSGVILPKPDDIYSELVHLADYLASRKDLTVEFVTQPIVAEKKEFDVNYTLPFGKHAGKRLIDIYRTTPDYVDWMEKNINKREVLDMIKSMKEYLKKQEEDL